MISLNKSNRRWLKSVLATSQEPLPSFAWMRLASRPPKAILPLHPSAHLAAKETNPKVAGLR